MLAAIPGSEARRGAITRLAMIEVEAMGWAAGRPIAADELGRDLMDARAGTDLAALHRARWAIARLQGRGRPDDLRGFLGLHRTDNADPCAPVTLRPGGAAFDAAAAEFGMGLAALADSHALIRAAYGSLLWRLADLSVEGEVIEPACWAARVIAEDCEAALFAPMAMAGRRLWIGGGGTPTERLSVWCDTVAHGAEASRQVIMRISRWSTQALRATAQIRGDNPARVIAALAARPLMPTAMVATDAGISRDTAERLLTRMAAMGLLREITGARRFRLWTAAV